MIVILDKGIVFINLSTLQQNDDLPWHEKSAELPELPENNKL